MQHPPKLNDGLVYRTVHGHFPYADGMGRIPAVEFRSNSRLTSRGSLLTTQEPCRIALNTDGRFEIDLLTTDSNPEVYPDGWAWEIREDFRGGGTYWFLLPLHDGSPISISTISPIPAKPPVIGASSGPRGPQGEQGVPGDAGQDGAFKVWRQPVKPDQNQVLVSPGDLWFEMEPPPPPVEGGIFDG